MPHKKPCIICDIDNVFMDSTMLDKYIPKERNSREGWDFYNAKYGECQANYEIINMLCNHRGNLPIYFMTSREDRGCVKEVTHTQIFVHSYCQLFQGLHYELLMRPENSYEEDFIVKEALLRQHILENGMMPVLAIDDNIKNIAMFKEFGIFTIHYQLPKLRLSSENAIVAGV